MHAQTILAIVDNDLCVGCGVCAGCCPSNNLRMHWKDNGDRSPALMGECPPHCKICLKVCPFGPSSNSEDRLALARFAGIEGITQYKEIGYYLSTFVGYSCRGDQRERGASGGMATWIFESLFQSGKIDAAVCVSYSDCPDQLFAYQIIEDGSDLKRTAGTRYYPVDLAEVLAILNSNELERRYAIVGLPCFLKGLCLAMEMMPRLRRRIIFTIGLTCGHLPNRFYTEYLIRLSRAEPKSVVSVQYRLKKGSRRAGNYLFRAIAPDGHQSENIPFSRINHIWHDGFFWLNACNYCEDVFSEVADIALMDAWLPEFEGDPRGHSLIIARDPSLLEILREGERSGTCQLSPISPQKVLQSQRGVIHDKRVMLAGRLFRARIKSIPTPEKRVVPDETVYQKYKRQIEARFRVQHLSKTTWPLLKAKSINLFQRKFLFITLPFVLQRLSGKIARVMQNPTLLLRRLTR